MAYFAWLKQPLLLLFILSPIIVHPQAGGNTALQLSINANNIAHPKQVLFVQTDKTVYTASETIWFAGYLLQDIIADSPKADILFVTLVNEQSKKIILQKNYLLQDGLCSGSLLLPDTLDAGGYSLVAYTNLLYQSAKPIGQFCQPITIKTTGKAPFATVFTIVKNTDKNEFINLQVKAVTVDSLPVKGATVQYTLPGQGQRTIVTGADGEGGITITPEQAGLLHGVLPTITTYQQKTVQINVLLPIKTACPGAFAIGFYPEGGNLVTGLQSRVAWEVKTCQGLPAQVSAVLMEDSTVIDTLQSNAMGMGSFMLLPRPQKKYMLRVIEARNSTNNSVYLLPKPLMRGVVLAVNNNVAADSLRLKLKATGQRAVSIAITNKFSGTVSSPVSIAGERDIVIPLQNIDKGINTITIVNDEGKAEAECLFFAHYDKRNLGLIKPDKTRYSTREKVHIVIQCQDENKAALGGVFSIACVQKSRLEAEKQQDIETYLYTQGLTDDLRGNTAAQMYNDTAMLHYVLLIKGWRRYTWQGLMETKGIINGGGIEKIELTGQLTKNSRPLKKTGQLVLMRDSVFSIISTDNVGVAHFDPRQMVVPETRQALLKIANDDNMLQLVFRDSISQLVGNLIKSTSFSFVQPPAVQGSLIEARNNTVVNVLPEVVVKNKATMPLAFKVPVLNGMGANACGDYLCAVGILNCYHHDGPLSSPIEGEHYYDKDGNQVTYKGCLTPLLYFKPNNIYTAREFYGVDSHDLKVANPIQMSTILWKPLLTIDKTGSIDFDFWTSDLKGRFSILIQGIGANGDVLFAEKNFTVGD